MRKPFKRTGPSGSDDQAWQAATHRHVYAGQLMQSFLQQLASHSPTQQRDQSMNEPAPCCCSMPTAGCTLGGAGAAHQRGSKPAPRSPSGACLSFAPHKYDRADSASRTTHACMVTNTTRAHSCCCRAVSGSQQLHAQPAAGAGYSHCLLHHSKAPAMGHSCKPGCKRWDKCWHSAVESPPLLPRTAGCEVEDQTPAQPSAPSSR